MDRINTDAVKKFYEDVPDVWPENDNWHLYSRRQIEKYVQKAFKTCNSTILNVG